MATENAVFDFTLTSSGDMSSNQYRAVVASSANVAGGCVRVAARGAAVTAVFQENSTSARASRVRALGITKVAAGDSSALDTAITEGMYLVASSVGQAVPSSAADLHAFCLALEPLTTGSTGIIKALLISHITTG